MIYLLHNFVCRDKKESLQRFLMNTKNRSRSSYKEKYDHYVLLMNLADIKKYKRRRLTWQEKLHLAHYYKSFQNEIAGKTILYEMPER